MNVEKSINSKNREWLANLNDEDVEFIRKFVIHSGSLKKLSQEYNVSYPTVRVRLDSLIKKVNSNEAQTEFEYISYIKKIIEENDINSHIAKKANQQIFRNKT